MFNKKQKVTKIGLFWHPALDIEACKSCLKGGTKDVPNNFNVSAKIKRGQIPTVPICSTGPVFLVTFGLVAIYHLPINLHQIKWRQLTSLMRLA
jgi:hypothetical protein